MRLSATNLLENAPPRTRQMYPNVDENSWSYINSESKKILEFVLLKYPQTEQRDVNKRLKEALSELQVNNLQNDDYDLIEASKVKFSFKEDGDYTSEIMQFFNYLIDLPSKPYKNTGMTNSQAFDTLMTNIFNLPLRKDGGNDLDKVLNPPEIKKKEQLSDEET